MLIAAAALAVLPVPSALAQSLPNARDGDLHTEHRELVDPGIVRSVLGRSVAEQRGANWALAGSGPCGDAVFDTLLPTGETEGDTPSALAFTPDGATIVVANRGSHNLTLFDASSKVFLGAVDISGSPHDLAITSNGATAVVANLFEDTVSIVDLGTLTEAAVVAVGEQPGIVRITPDGTRAVVANTVGQSVSVVDIATATELQRIAGAGFTATLTITGESGVVTTSFQSLEVLDDGTALATDFTSDELDFFDLVAGSVTSLPCDPDPRGLDVTPDGTTAVVVHTGAQRTLSVVDTVTPAVTQTHATSIDLQHHVALRPDASSAVVAVSNGALVVDLGSGVASPTLSTASINGMGTTADGDYALTYGFQGALISFDSQAVVAQLNLLKSAYAGGVSPVDARGAMLINHNAEDMVIANTNGVAAFQEDVLATGPNPEADSPRKVAVSPDGTRAVTTNILSDNASIFDLESGAVLGVAAVGDRPADVEITADGGQAVVANLDSSFVSVIDLGTLAVTNIPISTRGGEVELAPDGSYAYVAVVVSDGVWRIDLDTLTVDGPKLPVGEMGSVFYGYQQMSGMTLSHDGATLVTCNSFDDNVTLIDTASWTVLATVTVGDFPTRATFGPGDVALYVANKNDDTISVIDVASATNGATIPVGDGPFEMVVTPDGSRLFVANSFDDELGMVDLGTGAQTTTIGLPAAPQALHMNSDGTCLSVASLEWLTSFGPGPNVTITTSGYVSVINPLGLGTFHQVSTGLPSAAMAFDACDGAALVPSPNFDAIARVRRAVPTSEVFGCTAPAGSMSLVSGSPKLGTQFVVGVDNPLGTQAAGALPVVLAALASDPAFPCGTALPGLGMAGSGAAGELLVSLLPGDYVLAKSGAPWAGPGQPAPVDLNVPPSCGLVGLDVFVQGVLVNPFGQPGVPAALAQALRLSLGV